MNFLNELILFLFFKFSPNPKFLFCLHFASNAMQVALQSPVNFKELGVSNLKGCVSQIAKMMSSVCILIG